MSVLRAVDAARALVIQLIAMFKFPWRKKSQRLIIATLAAVLLLATVIGVSESRVAVKRSWLILTNGLVDVGGYRLRLTCEGNGSPVVVMDAGLNQTIPTWGRVPAGVATFTRTCTYDRAGLGGSDRGPVPRTSQQIVVELHALLGNAGLHGPYVLVGHSFGGQNVRLYASEYPKDVAGMVLVNASHEDQYARFGALLPPEQRKAYLEHEGGANDEHVDMITSGAQVRAARPLMAMPLIVLTSQPATPPTNSLSAQIVYELQAELAQVVPNGKQVMVSNSEHFIQIDQPQAVIDAIHEVVEATRPQSPLLSQTTNSGYAIALFVILAVVILIMVVCLMQRKSPFWVLRRFWHRWQAFGKALGDVVGRIVMSIFYFTLAAPFGLVVRLFGDPLKLKPEQPIWERRKVEPDTLEAAKRSF